MECPPGEPATAIAVAMVQIRWLTQKKNWTPPQQKMMRKAGRYHAVRDGGWSSLLAVATFMGLTIRRSGD